MARGGRGLQGGERLRCDSGAPGVIGGGGGSVVRGEKRRGKGRLGGGEVVH